METRDVRPGDRARAGEEPDRRDRGHQHPALRGAPAAGAGGDDAARERHGHQHHARQRPRRSATRRVQPQNQIAVRRRASAMPVLAAAQWAARTQAMDQVEIARLSIDRHAPPDRGRGGVGVPGGDHAEAPGRGQPDARSRPRAAQLDYNTRRREGGVGSRLNELRSAQVLSSRRGAARGASASTSAARRKRSACCWRPTVRSTSSGEPAFEVPADGARDRVAADAHRRAAASPPQRDADRAHRQRQLEGLVADGGGVVRSAVPDAVGPLPAVRTWRLSLSLVQPIYDGGQRRGAAPPARGGPAGVDAVARAGCRSRRARKCGSRARRWSRRSARWPAPAQAAQQANEVLKITIVAFDAGVVHQHRGDRRAALGARPRDRGGAGRGCGAPGATRSAGRARGGFPR